MWFWHILALALGRTVAELQSVMTPVEFSNWAEFYRKWPFDDLHRFHRPAALSATIRTGTPPTEFLDYLQPPELPEGMTDVDLQSLRAFGLSPPGK